MTAVDFNISRQSVSPLWILVISLSLSLFFSYPSCSHCLRCFRHLFILRSPVLPSSLESRSAVSTISLTLFARARARRLTSRACLLDFRWQRHVERSSPFCFLSATGCSPMRPSAQGNTIAFKDLLSPPTYYFYSFSVGSQLLGVIASAF